MDAESSREKARMLMADALHSRVHLSNINKNLRIRTPGHGMSLIEY
jgi:hypothetical protein